LAEGFAKVQCLDLERMSAPKALVGAREHIADVEPDAERCYVLDGSQRGGGIVPDDVELTEPGKVGDDVLGDALRKPPREGVLADGVERQHGYGGLRPARGDRARPQEESGDGEGGRQRDHRDQGSPGDKGRPRFRVLTSRRNRCG
jgi:hypothetical protein